MKPTHYWSQAVSPEISLDRTALVVVDMQRWCAHPESTMAQVIRRRLGPDGGRYYFTRIASTVIPNIQRLLGWFRVERLPVIYLTIGKETPDASDLNALWRLRDRTWAEQGGVPEYLPLLGSSEHAILPEVAPAPGEVVLNKTTAGAFNSSRFQEVLNTHHIEALYFTGVVTNGCVGTTLRDAADRGYVSALIEDACAAMTAEMHAAAVLFLGTPMADVMSTDAALGGLAARRASVNVLGGKS